MKQIDIRDVITWFGIFLVVMLLAICMFSCAPLRNTETTVRDSTIVREFDIKIPEKTITHQVDLDSLCRELDNLKALIRSQKSSYTTVYQSDTMGRAQLLAQIDSLGVMILQATAAAVDTTGNETVRVREESKVVKETQRRFLGMHPAWLVAILVLVLIIILGIGRMLR